MDWHPHTPGRLAHDLHLAQHGLVAEILQADPEAARGDILLRDHGPWVLTVRIEIRGGEDRRQGRGRRRGGPADGDAADVAGTLEAEEEVVQLERGREGGQAQARGRGVLEVGAGVGEEDKGHAGSLCTRGRRSRGVRGRRGRRM